MAELSLFGNTISAVGNSSFPNTVLAATASFEMGGNPSTCAVAAPMTTGIEMGGRMVCDCADGYDETEHIYDGIAQPGCAPLVCPATIAVHRRKEDISYQFKSTDCSMIGTGTGLADTCTLECNTAASYTGKPVVYTCGPDKACVCKHPVCVVCVCVSFCVCLCMYLCLAVSVSLSICVCVCRHSLTHAPTLT